MKSIKKSNTKKIKKAFVLTYRKKEERPVNDEWRPRVMEHIIGLGPHCVKAGYLTIFQQFVWKLSPALSVLAMILGIIISRIDFFTSYEFSKFFINTPADFILLTLLNK